MNPMRFLAACLAVCALVTPLAAQRPAQAATERVAGAGADLDLGVGKGELIRLSRPAKTVFIANPKIADVQVKSPTLVYVVAKAPGSTSLFAVDANEQMIANLTVNVGLDLPRLREMLQSQVPAAKVEVASANGALILTGKVNSATEGDDVIRIAKLFVPGEDKAAVIINRLTVEQANQINVRVRVAEISRQASNELRFNWESVAKVGDGVLGLATGADFVDEAGKFIRPDTALGGIIAGVRTDTADINLLLEALERKQLVSILAEPNLTATSGEPASFLAGGEYPIPVPQGVDQIVIEYKQYGVSLAFTATVLDGGRISLNVRPEVSQLTSAGAITLRGITVPALTTRRADTTVDLASGQSFAIAGLLANNVDQDLQKLPGLGDLPVLGQLFRSKRFQRNESELVIIVTPYLVKPVSRRLADPVERAAAVPAPSEVKAEATAPAAASTPARKG